MIKDNPIFSIDAAGGTPSRGSLLVAEPFLHDRNFAHAVICLVDYEPGGAAMGIVLNLATTYTLQEVLTKITAPTPIPVFCGGPMSCDRLFFMHTLGEAIIPGAREVAPGLFIGGDFDAMAAYINSGYPIEGRIRFFVGYSGWSPHQLEQELTDKVWAVTDIASPQTLLEGSEDAYWHSTVRRMGAPFRTWLMHPLNPGEN